MDLISDLIKILVFLLYENDMQFIPNKLLYFVFL